MTNSESLNHNEGSAVDASRAQLRSEVQEYLSVSEERRRLFPRAALVGLLAGVVAIAFRAALTLGDTARNKLIIWAHHYPAFGWLFPVCFSAAGACISVFMVRKFAPEAAGSGIPHLEEVLHRYRPLHRKRLLLVKFIGGTLALGGGLALGREGPTVQMGGTIGAVVSGWLKAGTRERLTLIAAGAGAGLAAAFDAPLSGVIFVLEEIQKDFQPAVFGATFLAAAVAAIVTRFASGQLPDFHVPSYSVPGLIALLAFAVLGLSAGVMGVLYNRSLILTLNLFAKVPRRFAVHLATSVGACVGLVAWFSPSAVGGGHSLAETFLEGHATLAVIPIWFLVRFVLSMASYGTGAPGGIFAPLLVLGALLGLAVGEIAHQRFPHLIPIPAIFAVVGMAAYFTAIVRAPLTGVVLIVELTGNYGLMLPLLVSCFCAYVVAEAMGELPIYESLLERDLIGEGAISDPTAPVVVELKVKGGCAFEGLEVRELRLPPGCILVSFRQGMREWIPTATSRLEAMITITAMVSPEAKGALELLRSGCESRE